MPVAPHMDPDQTNTASGLWRALMDSVWLGQIGFISYLATPLFMEMTRIFPGLQVCCDQMMVNKEKWQLVEQQQQANRNTANKV